MACGFVAAVVDSAAVVAVVDAGTALERILDGERVTVGDGAQKLIVVRANLEDGALQLLAGFGKWNQRRTSLIVVRFRTTWQVKRVSLW